jgi:hypothetical protein
VGRLAGRELSVNFLTVVNYYDTNMDKTICL